MRIEIKCVRKSVKSTKNLNCISTTSIIRLLAECFFDLFNVKVLWICDWHFTWILSIVLPPNHHTRIDLNTDHNPFPNVSAFLTKNFLFLLFEKPNATIGIVIEDNNKNVKQGKNVCVRTSCYCFIWKWLVKCMRNIKKSDAKAFEKRAECDATMFELRQLC